MAVDKQIPVKPFYLHAKNMCKVTKWKMCMLNVQFAGIDFFSITNGEMVAGKKQTTAPFAVKRWIGVVMMTNGDRLRAMSDEELAEMFDKLIQDCEYCPMLELCFLNCEKKCKVMYLNWLREEAKTDE